jgi:hypothetical protein
MRRTRLAYVLPAVTAALALAVPVVWSQPPAAPAQPPAAPAVPEKKVEPPPPPATPEEAAALAIDQKIIELAKPGHDGSQVMANLTHLSDVIGPRLTGSDNLRRANDWAAEKMKQYGLENVRQEPWTIPMAWQRGTTYVRLAEPDNGRTLFMASGGWSPSTKGRVTGDVVIVRAQNKEDLAKFKGKLKNAIVMQRPPSNVRPLTDFAFRAGGGPGAGGPGAGEPNRRPGDNPPAGGGRPDAANPNNPAANPPAAGERSRPDARPGTPPAPTPTDRGRPDAPPAPPAPADRGNPQTPAPGGQPPAPGAQPPAPRGGGGGGGGEFFRRGSAFSNELNEFFRAEGVAATLTDAGKPHGLMTMSGSWRNFERANAGEPIPTLYVPHDHYALLWRLASRPEPAKTQLELEITNKLIPGPVTVYNTVGEIRGSEKPDEYVVVGAHLDSWDLAQGTTDNGTGSCVVLEAARIIAKSGVRPKRTIRFILFTGEEQGLHGSRAFVNAHKDDMPKTSIAIVHDTGTGKVIGINTAGQAAIKAIFDKELTPSLKPLGVDITSRGGFGGGGSDHASFNSAGVPGILFSQDTDEYRFTHHSQSDTLDKAKEPNLVQGAQVMAVFATRIANLDSLLPRMPVQNPPRRGTGTQ